MPENWLKVRANVLEKKVSDLFEASKDIVKRIDLIDTIEHLGIGHLFEKEITNALCDIQYIEFNSSNLYEVSLRFRLLREHGLWASSGLDITSTVFYYNISQ